MTEEQVAAALAAGTFCQGEPITEEQIKARFRPGDTETTTVGYAYTSVRRRQCTSATGCGPWTRVSSLDQKEWLRVDAPTGPLVASYSGPVRFVVKNTGPAFWLSMDVPVTGGTTNQTECLYRPGDWCSHKRQYYLAGSNTSAVSVALMTNRCFEARMGRTYSDTNTPAYFQLEATIAGNFYR